MNTTTTNATADANATAAFEKKGNNNRTTIMPASLPKY
jgi:hypothetical protein